MSISTATNRRVALRLLPLLCALQFVSYLDRVTLSYAGPGGMNKELGLSATAFGFAAGIFFLGYILLELPSNVALARFGARRWLARIAVTWGAVQCLTVWVSNAEMLYLLRFLLGVAEAGLAPGVLLYLTYWFGPDFRGRAVTRFLTSAIVATVVGAPLSYWVLTVGDAFQPIGLVGWRLLMLVTGAPAIVLGIVAWFYLEDGPQAATWLSPEAKVDLASRLDVDDQRNEVSLAGIRAVLGNGHVWRIGLCYLSFIYGAFALTFFLPTIIVGFQGQFGVRYTPAQAALLSAIPFACGAAAQLYVGRRTDRRGRLGVHLAVSAGVGCAGALAAAFATSPTVLVVCLCVMAAGLNAGGALPLVLATTMYTGVQAAAAIALVNTIGLSAGFFGPYLTGWLKDATGAPSAGIVLMAVLLAAAGLIGLRSDRVHPLAGASVDTAGDDRRAPDTT